MIQASSAQSIAGTIVIDSPDTDIAGSLTPLPESFLDASALLPQRCAVQRSASQSSFIVAGRGGLPPDPDGYLSSSHAAGLTMLRPVAKSAIEPTTAWHNDTNKRTLALVAFGCGQ